MHKSLLLVFLVFLGVGALSASAMNKCTDKNGAVTFQDQPCAPGSTSTNRQPLGAIKLEPKAVQTPAEVAAGLEKQLGEKIKSIPTPDTRHSRVSQNQPPESSSRLLDFESCTKMMIRNIAIYGSDSTQVVTSSSDVKIQRICTADGSVLVTCSRPDYSMVITKTQNQCQ